MCAHVCVRMCVCVLLLLLVVVAVIGSGALFAPSLVYMLPPHGWQPRAALVTMPGGQVAAEGGGGGGSAAGGGGGDSPELQTAQEPAASRVHAP